MVTSKSAEVGDRILKVTFCFILMEEIWKDIEGYEGLYQVSSLGRVRSCERIVKRKDYGDVLRPQQILKQYDNGTGYLRVVLYDNRHKSKKHYIHRLVAEVFVKNPLCLPNINHKDENKHNNNASNLEWCTQKYNINYGTRTDRMRISQGLPVVGTNIISGEKVFLRCIADAKKIGLNPVVISRCCKGNGKTSGGYKWEYQSDIKQ